MKALMIKDFALIKKIIILMFAMSVLMLILKFNSVSFMISYMTMLSACMVISTIAYDDAGNGMSFLLTLPVTRRIYVIEKYLFSILCIVLFCVSAIVLSLISDLVYSNAMLWGEYINNAAAAAAIAIIFIAIEMPMQFKFGSEKFRIILISIIVLCAAVIFAVSRLMKYIGVDLSWVEEYFSGTSYGVLAAITAGFSVLVLIVSYLISSRIIMKKEY